MEVLNATADRSVGGLGCRLATRSAPQPLLAGSRPGCNTDRARAPGASRFYADHYRALPSGPIRLEELDRLPAVTKPELIARVDD